MGRLELEFQNPIGDLASGIPQPPRGWPRSGRFGLETPPLGGAPRPYSQGGLAQNFRSFAHVM